MRRTFPYQPSLFPLTLPISFINRAPQPRCCITIHLSHFNPCHYSQLLWFTASTAVCCTLGNAPARSSTTQRALRWTRSTISLACCMHAASYHPTTFPAPILYSKGLWNFVPSHMLFIRIPSMVSSSYSSCTLVFSLSSLSNSAFVTPLF